MCSESPRARERATEFVRPRATAFRQPSVTAIMEIDIECSINSETAISLWLRIRKSDLLVLMAAEPLRCLMQCAKLNPFSYQRRMIVHKLG